MDVFHIGLTISPGSAWPPFAFSDGETETKVLSPREMEYVAFTQGQGTGGQMNFGD